MNSEKTVEIGVGDILLSAVAHLQPIGVTEAPQSTPSTHSFTHHPVGFSYNTSATTATETTGPDSSAWSDISLP